MQTGLEKIFVNAGYQISEAELNAWRRMVTEYSAAFNSHSIPNLHINDVGKGELFRTDLITSYLDDSIDDSNCSEMWDRHRRAILDHLRNQNAELLLDPIIRYAIYLTSGSSWSNVQLEYLKGKYSSERLSTILKENHQFSHTIVHESLETSESKINFATHLTEFFEHVSLTESEVSTIVEFGGGYGGMTEMLRMFFPSATVYVIDFPELHIVQEAYLRRWNPVFIPPNSKIFEPKRGAIHLVSLYSVTQAKIVPDLLIGTWSISECDEETCYIIDHSSLVKSKHLLFGYRFRESPSPHLPNSFPRNWMLPRSKFHDFCFFAKNAHKYLFY